VSKKMFETIHNDRDGKDSFLLDTREALSV
jgi:hypothetical protein